MFKLLGASVRNLSGSCHSLSPHGNFRKAILLYVQFDWNSSHSRGYGDLRFVEQSKTRFMNIRIVDALHCGNKEMASSFLWRGDCENKQLTSEDLHHILQYCSTAPDPLFAMEVWKFVHERNIKIDQKCCTLILLSLIKGGYLDEALSLSKTLAENHQTKPLLSIYNAFLSGCNQNPALAIDCLQMMEEQFVGKSEETYGELLKLAVLQKNLTAIGQIWKEYTRFYSPRLIYIHKFIWAFTKLGDLTSAYAMLQHMVKETFTEDMSRPPWKWGRFSPKLDIPVPMISNKSRYLDSDLDVNDSCCSAPDCNSTLSKGITSLVKNRLEISNIMGETASISVEELQSPPVGYYDKGLSLNGFPCPSVFKLTSVEEKMSTISQKRIFLYSSNSEKGSQKLEKCGPADGQQMTHGIPRSVQKLLLWSFNLVMQACAQSEECYLAESLLMQMNELGLKPSQYTFKGLLKAVISTKGITCGMDVVGKMLSLKLKLDNASLSALAVGYSKCLKLDLAEAMLDRLDNESPKYIYPFNYFIAACEIQDKPELAVRIFEKIRHLKIKPDIRTYELLLSVLGKVNAPYSKGNMLSRIHTSKRLRAIEMDMAKNEIQHSSKSLQNMMRVLGAEGMIEEMVHYLNLAEKSVTIKDACAFTDVYNTVLHELVETNENNKAAEIFRKMKMLKIPCTSMTYNIMIHCCGMIKCYRSACSFLAIMLRDGFEPVASTFTTLIEAVATEDFVEALCMLDKASAIGIKADVILFNAILQKASSKHRLDIIEHIIERMHQEKVQPDPTTCRYTFCSYVYHGFHSTAVEALQVLSIRMISENENIQEQCRSQYEELVVSDDKEAEEKIFKIFRDSREYLAVALLNLRWSALLGDSVSWKPDESPWARRLASSYGQTKFAL